MKNEIFIEGDFTADLLGNIIFSIRECDSKDLSKKCAL
jgi:hypothetical protein